jgi:2Fe-2S ferredoxin
MHASVDNNIGGMSGKCGRSCATCLCYIDPVWVAKAGAPDRVELNPVCADIVTSPEHYQLSSFHRNGRGEKDDIVVLMACIIS